MSFPIPSFFKIRCGIIIIAFLLFFMFIGMLKQALAACDPLLPDAGYTADNHVYTSQAAAVDACVADYASSCFYASGGGWSYYYYVSPGVQHFYAYGCTLPCPDSNNNGTPDACESCPSQSGYKSNILGVITYCGNTVTQCNGQSHTSYEWGFSSDNCTPTQEPDCHVTADCKKDLNNDGIADGSEGGGTYSGNPKADRDGDGIPDLKDCDFDFDGDSKKNCEDPCPLKSNPGTAICPDPCEGGTPQCQDADGDGIVDCSCPVYGGTDCWTCADGDGDGVPNGFDNDIDGDGIPNAQDSDMDGDGILNTEDDDIDGDGIPNSEDEDDDGDGTPDGEETKPYAPTGEPYSIEEETSSEFKEALKARFQEFLDKLKTTSLFSIPSRLNNIVPTGSGDSKIIIDGGQTYGQNEIDFSGWTQGLAALNAVIYIACYSIAIRIIILKR